MLKLTKNQAVGLGACVLVVFFVLMVNYCTGV